MNLEYIKTDEQSIYLLCNSLNAWQSIAQHRGERRLANLLLKAQGTIVKLHEENKALKEGKKE